MMIILVNTYSHIARCIFFYKLRFDGCHKVSYKHINSGLYLHRLALDAFIAGPKKIFINMFTQCVANTYKYHPSRKS